MKAPEEAPKPEACRSCKAPVLWAVSKATGKAAPIDAEPVPDGNLVLTLTRSTGLLTSEIARPDVHQGRRRFVSHFSTCPQSKNWRKK